MKSKEIKDIIRFQKLHPNKKLGQHFLCNTAVIDRIVEVSGIKKEHSILEIGAGLGAVTERLVKVAKNVTAVEIDSGLVKYLKERYNDIENLNIIHADFLKIDLKKNFSKSVSNLPYYCSSEILFRLALNYSIDEVYIMLQKEMAERITSNPGTKSYGALSVTLQLYYEPTRLFKIDKQSFYPRPEIDSSFIRLKRSNRETLCNAEIDLFHRIVKSAFWGRRKTLIKALSESPFIQFDKSLLNDVLYRVDIDSNIRGEDLEIDDFINISKVISQRTGPHL